MEAGPGTSLGRDEALRAEASEWKPMWRQMWRLGDIAKWNRKNACGEAWSINIRRVLILLAINAVSCRAGHVVFVLIYKDLGPSAALGTVCFQRARLYACTPVRLYAPLPRSSTLPRGKGGDAELGLRGPRGSPVHAI
jgi:hypothetical protein